MEKYKSNSESQNKTYYNNHPSIIERFDTSKNGSTSHYKDGVSSSIKFRDVSLSILLEEENSNNINKQFL